MFIILSIELASSRYAYVQKIKIALTGFSIGFCILSSLVSY